MRLSNFISKSLKYKGRVVTISVAISFLIIILSVSVLSGYKKEIRQRLSSYFGDIRLKSVNQRDISDSQSINRCPSYLNDIKKIEGVEAVNPVIYRTAVVKSKNTIHGVLFKGIETDDLNSLNVSIPQKLADILGLQVGDRMLSYFVGNKLKIRRFTIASIYKSLIDSKEKLIVYAPINDIQRINLWDSTQVSSFEIIAKNKDTKSLEQLNESINNICFAKANDYDIEKDEDSLLAETIHSQYFELFNWLDLLDFNVLFILILMIIVAGFNMCSCLLIILFKHISIIGTLKALGMRNFAISKIFLSLSSKLLLKGMLIGNVLSIVFALLQNSFHLLTLNPETYFLSYVPVNLDIIWILSADIIAYFSIMLILILPAMYVSKIDPAISIKRK